MQRILNHAAPAALLALGATLTAQTQTSTVPATRAGSEGVAVSRVAGFSSGLHQQILIDPVHLQGMSGRTIRSISFRRDSGTDDRPLEAGQAALRVWLSTASGAAHTAEQSFAANRGANRTLVFDGTVALPATPVGSATSPAPFTVRLDLDPTAPFVHPGGTLVVEIEGTPVAGSASNWWPVDAESEAIAGAVTSVGASCSALSMGGSNDTAHAAAGDLVPGRTASFLLRTEPSALSVVLVGLAAQADVLGLGRFGFRAGCRLHLAGPIVGSLSTVAGATAVSPRLGAPAAVEVQLPADASMFGSRFAVQWVEGSSTGLRTSNALDLQVAGGLPTLGMATVTAGDPTAVVGRVDPTAAPIVQFEHD